MGVSQNGVNPNFYSDYKCGVSVMEGFEPKGVKAKMREHILTGCVNWQGALQQKGVKQKRV
jgi:hypothetical protein